MSKTFDSFETVGSAFKTNLINIDSNFQNNQNQLLSLIQNYVILHTIVFKKTTVMEF